MELAADDLVNVLDLDAADQAYKGDPYPLYEQLRRSAPVSRVTLNGMPAWLVTRHDDVRAALAEPNLNNSLDHLNAELAAAGLWAPSATSATRAWTARARSAWPTSSPRCAGCNATREPSAATRTTSRCSAIPPAASAPAAT